MNEPKSKPSFTVDEWCHHRRICRATFYNLLKVGKAPQIIKVGSRTTISAEADEEWRREREAEAAKKVAA
ncbi:MAG TPA: hypothetical protein VHY35_02040 [Stellaceae bacterium]|jgi:predicted DNA-binding transcriptional regulator AlpA|nr:hypothetical protein [Stellaceae bacterium]